MLCLLLCNKIYYSSTGVEGTESSRGSKGSFAELLESVLSSRRSPQVRAVLKRKAASFRELEGVVTDANALHKDVVYAV